MKQLKSLIIPITLVILYALSYYLGRLSATNEHSKDYQVAQIMTTCCNNMIDNLGNDAEEIYHEYIDNLDCYPDITITKEDIDKYNSWN